MKNPARKQLFESLFEGQYRNWINVRVWRQEDELKDVYPFEDLVEFLEKSAPVALTPSQLAKALASLPRVNAVQVESLARNSILIYNDWP